MGYEDVSFSFSGGLRTICRIISFISTLDERFIGLDEVWRDDDRKIHHVEWTGSSTFSEDFIQFIHDNNLSLRFQWFQWSVDQPEMDEGIMYVDDITQVYGIGILESETVEVIKEE